ADRLGCYGNAAVSTPVLDDLAARGARFAHAVAPAPLTLPSHASLLTATSPLRHGVHDNIGFALPAAIPTIAEQFRAAGYATAALVSGAPLQQRFGLGRGFDRYDDRFTSAGGAAPANAVERRADQTVAAADRGLRKPGGAPHPIFMWVHFFDPHAPYEPPEP